jgi:putative RNA 2'-phosphotransferase
MDPSLVKTSKFLSLVLRHRPERIGLTLSEDGWAKVSELLHLMTAAGHPLTRETLMRVVAENDKQRFAMSEDGSRVRASQGHSLEIDLDLPPVEPPALLYHGTAERFVDSILEHGLLRGSRNHVHLSLDVETATRVGQRHGKPTVLLVAAGVMQRDGRTFFLSENGVWLTEHVPREYLQRAGSARKID